MGKTMEKKTRATRLNNPPKSKKYMEKELKALLEGIKEKIKDKKTTMQQLRSPPTDIEKALIIEEYPFPLQLPIRKTRGKIILPHLLGDIPQETCPKKKKPAKTATKK